MQPLTIDPIPSRFSEEAGYEALYADTSARAAAGAVLYSQPVRAMTTRFQAGDPQHAPTLSSAAAAAVDPRFRAAAHGCGLLRGVSAAAHAVLAAGLDARATAPLDSDVANWLCAWDMSDHVPASRANTAESRAARPISDADWLCGAAHAAPAAAAGGAALAHALACPRRIAAAVVRSLALLCDVLVPCCLSHCDGSHVPRPLLQVVLACLHALLAAELASAVQRSADIVQVRQRESARVSAASADLR